MITKVHNQTRNVNQMITILIIQCELLNGIKLTMSPKNISKQDKDTVYLDPAIIG
jgi:hypothetical protein